MLISKRWQIFTAAPHRVMFFGGALQAVAAMVWLLTELGSRHVLSSQVIAWKIAPGLAHPWLMIYGLFPMFMFGFLMTTYPRWMKGGEIAPRQYVPAFALLMLGLAGFYAGLLFSHAVLIVSVICTLSGWGLAQYALLRVLIDTPRQDKRHPQIIFIALCLGWCGLLGYLAWLWDGDVLWLRLSVQGGLWLFLLPVFSSIAHRMIPFFTSSGLKQQLVASPEWAWWVMLASSAGHGLLEVNDASAWLWLCDFPLAIVALFLTNRWGFRRSMQVPLLAVLHLGFAWLGVAMLLFAVQSFASLLSHGNIMIWGLAPLHALTIGCFATLLIGMATRVTLGHAGMPMKVGRSTCVLFVGLQLAALLRVLADMLPMPVSPWLHFVAGIVWLACFAAWFVRHVPVYWRPRSDGQSG